MPQGSDLSRASQDDHANRLSNSFTVLLTITAYTLVVGDCLPTLGYLTFLDRFTLSAYFLCGLLILELTAMALFVDPDNMPVWNKACAIGNGCAFVLLMTTLIVYVKFWVIPDELCKTADEPDEQNTTNTYVFHKPGSNAHHSHSNPNLHDSCDEHHSPLGPVSSSLRVDKGKLDDLGVPLLSLP